MVIYTCSWLISRALLSHGYHQLYLDYPSWVQRIQDLSLAEEER
jgi:hypothetical protein